MTKARDTSNLVSSVTGIAVTLSGDPIILGVGNTQHFRLTGGGQIGVGKNPGKILDLQASEGLAIRYYDDTSTFKAGIEVATTAGDMIGGSAVNNFCIRSQTDMLFSAGGNTERFRITSGGNIGIGTTDPGRILHLSDANPYIRFTDTAQSDGYYEIGGTDSGYLLISSDQGNAVSGSAIVFNVDGSEAARFNSSGNLAFPSGQGIDFSGTGDGGETMTSELLDDYEEGTWTPVANSPGSNGFVDTSTFSNVKCFYTKIGRLVNLYGSFDIASNSGNIAQGDYLDLTSGCLPYGITQADITTLGDVWWYASLGGNSNASGQCVTVSGSYLRFFVQTVVGTISRNTAPMSFSLSYITT